MPDGQLTNEQLRDITLLGEETRVFIESDLGRSIFAKAEQYALDALGKLAEADPNQPVEILRLQERIRLAKSFPEWFDEIVNFGEQALVEWTQRNPGDEQT